MKTMVLALCIACATAGVAAAATPINNQDCLTILPASVFSAATGMAGTAKHLAMTGTAGCEYAVGGQAVLDFWTYRDGTKFYDLKHKTSMAHGVTDVAGLGTRAYTSTIDFLMQKGARLEFLETRYSAVDGTTLLVSTDQMQALMKAMLPRIK